MFYNCNTCAYYNRMLPNIASVSSNFCLLCYILLILFRSRASPCKAECTGRNRELHKIRPVFCTNSTQTQTFSDRWTVISNHDFWFQSQFIRVRTSRHPSSYCTSIKVFLRRFTLFQVVATSRSIGYLWVCLFFENNPLIWHVYSNND